MTALLRIVSVLLQGYTENTEKYRKYSMNNIKKPLMYLINNREGKIEPGGMPGMVFLHVSYAFTTYWL